MDLYAHSRPESEEASWQPLSQHLENVALLARQFAKPFCAGTWAFATGWGHDRGKATLEYQRRLRGDPRMADHSTAGAQWAANTFGPAGRLIAACIAGHHSGLLDGSSPDDSCLLKRLKKEVPPLQGDNSTHRILEPPGRFPFTQEGHRIAFQASFFTRMLFSCLVDADFLDTERFLDPDKAAWREGFPPLAALEKRFWGNCHSRLSKSEPTEINKRRKSILGACLAGAEKAPGLFSLTVPTGGGKTLSSLAFAIKHAAIHSLDRIVYVVPYTSIIEQNAAVFRDFLGEDAILEHHSAIDPDRSKRGGSEADEAVRCLELATENWNAPLVVTTAVQFFESLFASRTSRCRKLHNIARSVVILDEAQMLPVPFLIPCIEAVRELAINYGTTVVLCTATQPALGRNAEFDRGLEEVREIVEDPSALYEEFRRVEIEKAGKLSFDGVGARLREFRQVLCVVNTRREAFELFERIKGSEGACHLSALMCAEHRAEKLAQVKSRLKAGEPCRLVSTRLIEAGVDIDFPVVFRAIAGLDSIAQAAGRCNREGKLPGPGKLIVYTPEEGLPPGPFRPPAECADEIMRKHADPLSLAAVEEYFRLLYWRAGDRLDSRGIMKDLGEEAGQLLFPFRSIAEKFQFIPEDGEAVLIPWNDRARSIIGQLRRTNFAGPLLRRSQRFSVRVPWRILQELEASGAVERLQGLFPVLTEEGRRERYRDDIGFHGGGSDPMDPESWIV